MVDKKYLDILRPQGDRDHIVLIDKNNLPDWNSSIPRFHSYYWTIDYNALMVSTIIPLGTHSFMVPSQWRTNADFLGVRWVSEDKFSHPLFQYKTQNDYSSLVLAFRANPSDPERFTVTVVSSGVSYSYRLAPYHLNSSTNLYECVNPQAGTGRTYPASIIQDPEYTIPLDEMAEYKGTKDYIFILDFDDLRTASNYTGPKVPPNNLSMVSFDCVESSHGLGSTAFVSDMVDLNNGTFRMDLGGTNARAVLTAGDKLQAVWNYRLPSGVVIGTESEFTVKSFTGFGTGFLSVICEGSLPGAFVNCQSFFSRSLARSTPVPVINSIKYFTDFTLSGNGLKSVPRRFYPQPKTGMGMTFGFDDGYNLTPERVMEMTKNLGYEKKWVTYLGMSHYFNAETALMDKDSGEIVEDTGDHTMPVLFAGEGNAAVHFIQGDRPDRGVDAFQSKMCEIFNVAPGAILPINGATGSTAADRAASVNPGSDVWDPDQTGTKGGLWWWDLETDKPGPALINCIEKVGLNKPLGVVWAQGSQDVQAIAFPTDRNPVPTIARSKQATEKVFAHMRSLWGSDLKIVIQELSIGWGLTDPDNPSQPIVNGVPTDLRVEGNSWGDIVFSWLSYKDDPSTLQYYLDIYHPVNSSEVLVTYTVQGSNIQNNRITFDWPVELNVPIAVSVYGDQFPWTFLKWRVRRVNNTQAKSPIVQQNVVVDNNAFVKKVIVCGINSLIGGYFNDLSDTINHGGTGKPGRKDVIAASTFRKTFAANSGLRWVEVMPVMAVVGSSPINPMPYQPGFPTDNYWWNPTTDAPGPNLLTVDPIVKAIGRAPDYFIESGPGETTGIPYAPEGDRPAILAAWRTSNIAMLNWMRSNWGNPNLEIWFQGATTSWWGDEIPPTEVNFEGAKLLREAQRQMALNDSGFKMGSYVPDGNLYTTYYNEMAAGLGWVHYSLSGYHAVAAEMAKNMALNLNQASNPPDWTLVGLPTNLKAVRKVNGSNMVSWTGDKPDSNNFTLRILNPNNNAIVRTVNVTGTSFEYTNAMQVEDFNGEAVYMKYTVAEVRGQVTGPYASGEGSVYGSGTVPTGLSAIRKMADDVEFKWTAESGKKYYVTNIHASTNAIISQTVVDDGSLLFTAAEQIAAYGFSGVGFVNFKVYEYNEADQSVGPEAQFSGEPGRAVSPTNGAATKNASDDITMTWDVNGSVRWIVELLNVVDNHVIRTDDVTTPEIVFTAQQQRDEYGFTASTVAWNVTAVRSDGAVSAKTSFSASV